MVGKTHSCKTSFFLFILYVLLLLQLRGFISSSGEKKIFPVITEPVTSDSHHVDTL